MTGLIDAPNGHDGLERTVQSDGLAEIWTLSRPTAANALNQALVRRLDESTKQLELSPANKRPRVVIVTGGPTDTKTPVFCAGADLEEVLAIESAEQAALFSATMTALLDRWAALNVVWIGAIQGDAFGGGCELMLGLDIRIAAPTAGFSFRQARMGLSCGFGGLGRLVTLVGPGMAAKWLFAAERIDANQALSAGFVEELAVDPLTRAQTLAGDIALGSRDAIGIMKQLIRGHVLPSQDFTQLASRELNRFVASWASSDHQAIADKLRRTRGRER